MKYIKKAVFGLLVLILLNAGTTFVQAETGEGNIDGGGGEMGTGSEGCYWNNQKYGVRVTVVNTEGFIVSTPFDLANCDVSGSVIHFGKTCKLQYTAGQPLTPAGGSYIYSKPGEEMPRIVSSGK